MRSIKLSTQKYGVSVLTKTKKGCVKVEGLVVIGVQVFCIHVSRLNRGFKNNRFRAKGRRIKVKGCEKKTTNQRLL